MTITQLVEIFEIKTNKVDYKELIRELNKKLEELSKNENISVFQACYGKHGCD